MKEQIFTWLYRVFTFFVPGGIVLWTCLIEKLIDQEVSYFTKIGFVGIFVIVIMIIIAVFFLGKYYKKRLQTLQNFTNERMREIMLATDEQTKNELTQTLQTLDFQIKRTQARQDIFHNVCFIAPFVIAWIVMGMVENGILSMRGTLAVVTISMATGLGFNFISQYIKTKKV